MEFALTVLTRCYACRVKIQTPARYLGRKVPCPKCDAVVRIAPDRPVPDLLPARVGPAVVGQWSFEDTVSDLDSPNGVRDAAMKQAGPDVPHRPATGSDSDAHLSEGEIVLRDLQEGMRAGSHPGRKTFPFRELVAALSVVSVALLLVFGLPVAGAVVGAAGTILVGVVLRPARRG